MPKENETVELLRNIEKLCIELTSPAVVGTDDQQVLPCKSMTVCVDIYWSTVVVRIVGEWEYTASEETEMVFLLPTRGGSVTDAVVKSGINHVRTIARLKSKTIKELEKLADESDNNGNGDTLDEWSSKEMAIFDLSNNSHFYLPFTWKPCSQNEDENRVKANEKICIECEYVQPLTVVNKFYYLYIPLKFYHEINGFVDDIKNVYVQCMIHHPSSMEVKV